MLRVLVSFLVFAFLFSCAGPKQPVVGSQRVVEKSAEKRPEWITVPYFEDNEIMYFSGGVRGVADYALGLRQAKAEAVKNIAESIAAKVRTEFTQAARGANLEEGDVGRFVQDGIAMITDNINIQGMLPAETYYEKIEQVTDYGVKYFYDCYALYQLPKKDYELAKKRALEDMAKKYREENNKKAEEAALKLLEKIE